MPRALILLALAACLGALAIWLLMAESSWEPPASIGTQTVGSDGSTLADLRARAQRQASKEPEELAAPIDFAAAAEAEVGRAEFTASGRVIALGDGKPIPNVSVFFHEAKSLLEAGGYSLPETTQEPNGRTDRSGEFTLTQLPGSAVIGTFMAPGWTPAIARVPHDQPRTPSVFTAELRRSGSLAGVISGGPEDLELRVSGSAADLTVGSARIFVRESEIRWQARPAADGSYRLDDLPSRMALRVEVWKPGHQAPLASSDKPLNLFPGQTETIDFRLLQESSSDQ